MGEAKRRQAINKFTTLSALQACDVVAYKAARDVAEMWSKENANVVIKMRGMLEGINKLVDAVADIWGEKGGAECSKGCYFCCRQMVSVNPIELFTIAMEIITKFSTEEYKDFICKLNSFTDVPPDSRELAGKWCPLLRNGECSVYSKRPIACRTHQSISRQKCETTDVYSGKVPYIGNTKVSGMSARMAMEYVMIRDYNVRIERVSLVHGLLIVLQDFQSAWGAWISNNENIFSTIEGDETDDVGFTYTEFVLKAAESFDKITISGTNNDEE